MQQIAHLYASMIHVVACLDYFFVVRPRGARGKGEAIMIMILVTVTVTVTVIASEDGEFH